MHPSSLAEGRVFKVLFRAENSKPMVERFFAWLAEKFAADSLLPTSPFTKASAYALERQGGLSVFLSDPNVAIDTNHLEPALRVIPMGRKNWLFCWTEIGAEVVGKIQSLLVTCKLHGVDPYTYLVDVLQRIDSHPAIDVDLLTPRMRKEYFAKYPLRSDVDRLTVKKSQFRRLLWDVAATRTSDAHRRTQTNMRLSPLRGAQLLSLGLSGGSRYKK